MSDRLAPLGRSVCRLGLASRGNTHLDADCVRYAVERGVNFLNWCGTSGNCMSRAIASLGWDVHSARISTIGERARDAFYLTDAHSRRLADDPAALEELFLEAYMRA